MTRLVAVAFAVVFLLAACSSAHPSAEATPEPDPLKVVALDGDWVLSRTATADTTGVFTLGQVAVRYVVLGVADCDPTTCTGSVLSAATEDVFVTGEDAGPHIGGSYAFDGVALTITLDTQPLDCDDNSGGIVSDDQYSSDVIYDLELVDGESLATGTGTQDVAVTGDYTGPECPAGGHIDYDVQFLRRA